MRIDRWKVRQLMAREHIDSDAELARRVGVSKQTVSKWFAGSPFTPENLGKLCEVLSCTPNDVLTAGPIPKVTALAAELVAV